ncbi:hypothetical protein BH23BAC4_BH23BAC4_04760 [soil metagenome]
MRLSLLPLVCMICLAASAQGQTYQTVRIEIPRGGEEQLDALDLALDHGLRDRTPTGMSIETVLREDEVAAILQAGIRVEVLEADATAAYLLRNETDMRSGRSALPPGRSVQGFQLGTMGGFPTIAEAGDNLDRLHDLYPEIVGEKFEIGRSHQDRPIWAVRMSAAPSDENPQVLYTGLHHAREPASLTALLYFMHYLGEQYGSNSEVTALLENRVLWFVPIVNPDGYAYNEQVAPTGGGMWRKNRRNNGGSFGVDLNRNYAYRWGMNDSGSSGNAGSEVYRGPAPFSEPETSALRDFILERSIGVVLNYHSFGNYLIHPWGYAAGTYTPDHATYTALCGPMVLESGYVCGQAADVLYQANGDSDDWMYEPRPGKSKILAFTPELGEAFWPTVSRIVPIAEENLRMNLEAAHVAGGRPMVTDISISGVDGNPWVQGGTTADLSFRVTNAVSAEGAIRDAAAFISVSNSWIAHFDGQSVPVNIEPEGVVTVGPLSIEVQEGAPAGYTGSGVLAFELDTRIVTHPFTVTVGEPVPLFVDSGATLDAWQTTTWGLDTETFRSAPSSFADSPGTTYPNNSTRQLTLSEPINLAGRSNAFLSYAIKWDIESRYDAGRVQISTDGSTWTSLSGRFTRPASGIGMQPAGSPVYDGNSDWVEEQIDLEPWLGHEVRLRFELRSDASITGQGINVDNIRVETYEDGSGVSTEPGSGDSGFAVGNPYPNPSVGFARFDVTLPEAGEVVARLYDLLGREVVLTRTVVQNSGVSTIAMDHRGLANGIYVLRVQSGDFVVTRRLTIVN